MLDSQRSLIEYVIQRLKNETGLIKSNLALKAAIDRRCQICGDPSWATYSIHLQQVPGEWKELLNLIVIPETMFFRDRIPFMALSDWVQKDWLVQRIANAPASAKQTARKSILRVLSLPCSTGEEPYSIAMTLIKAGLSPAQFEIDAMDISDRCIEIAKRGQYSRVSDHAIQPFLSRDRAEIDSPKREIVAWLRSRIRFSTQSAFEALESKSLAAYDVIFCRNLMIYFDVAARKRLLNGLDRSLKTHGLLVVGHSEMGLVNTDRFTPLEVAHSCSFKKIAPANLSKSNLSKSNLSKSNLTEPAHPATAIQKTINPKPCTPTLHHLQQLADYGHLEQARQAGAHYLEHAPLCAEGYVTMAQIHLAIGDSHQAESALDRALYLNPKHLDALLQLSLLRSAKGDHAGSDRLNQRLKRIQQREIQQREIPTKPI